MTATAEALWLAQCRRLGIEPRPFHTLAESAQEKYHDLAISGRGTRLEDWHGDHTDLVHVLWSHDIHGEDADRLASTIQQSGYADARRAHDQIKALERLEAAIADGTDPAAAITNLKNDLMGDSQ